MHPIQDLHLHNIPMDALANTQDPEEVTVTVVVVSIHNHLGPFSKTSKILILEALLVRLAHKYGFRTTSQIFQDTLSIIIQGKVDQDWHGAMAAIALTLQGKQSQDIAEDSMDQL